jgi:hypothetical protein
VAQIIIVFMSPHSQSDSLTFLETLMYPDHDVP